MLQSYNNGNTQVIIYSDGTKVREYYGEANPIFPESIDCKITNWCNLGNICKWCHEESNLKGKHADLDALYMILKDLPAGVEIAIGGGNPLSHPDLASFLANLVDIGLIPNLTVNERHLKKHKNQLTQLIKDGLIYGLGISYSGVDPENCAYFESLTPNLVYHLIAGIHEVDVLDKVNNALVLGYKQHGKGVSYYQKSVQDNLDDWVIYLRKYLVDKSISFDNLAIKQLRPDRFIKQVDWDNFYMGDDGAFTMYIDAVEQKYAKSSTEKEQFDWLNIKEMFAKVRMM